MDLSEAAAAWRRDGFVVLPGYLAGPELAAAQRDLAVVYPSAEEYHAAPAEGRNRAYTGDEFGGVIPFPFATVALSRLVVHDKLIALAEAVFATSDIRIYAAELWAKYCGAASSRTSWPRLSRSTSDRSRSDFLASDLGLSIRS